MIPKINQFITKQESDRFENPSSTRSYERGKGKGNVKVLTDKEKEGTLSFTQGTFNKASAEIAEGVKSGAIAKENAAKSDRLNKSGKRAFPKDETVKIKSGY
jgi:hypothetical protein